MVNKSKSTEQSKSDKLDNVRVRVVRVAEDTLS